MYWDYHCYYRDHKYAKKNNGDDGNDGDEILPSFIIS